MRRIAGIIITIAAMAALILFAAGRWDWLPGWGFLVVAVTASTIESIWLYRHDPELIERRSRFGKGTLKFDYWFLAVFGIAFLGVLVVGPLDAGRFGWAPLPGWVFVIGAILYLIGEALVGWAMYENTFFEKTVRLQADRNHRTIATGPYAYIRHPGYVGFLVGYALGFPLMLTSTWALAPAAIAAIAVIIRTELEDRFLAGNLDGYEEYQKKVRYRLIPGLW